MVDKSYLPPERRKLPMKGRREFASKLYYQLSLDHLVPQDNMLRDIAGPRQLAQPPA